MSGLVVTYGESTRRTRLQQFTIDRIIDGDKTLLVAGFD